MVCIGISSANSEGERLVGGKRELGIKHGVQGKLAYKGGSYD